MKVALHIARQEPLLLGELGKKKKEEGKKTHKAECAIVSSDDVRGHIISPELRFEQDWVTAFKGKEEPAPEGMLESS